MFEQQEAKSTRAIVTVLGADKIGIIAAVTTILSNHRVNILDISQTIMQEFFTMIMVCDLVHCQVDFAALSDQLEAKGREIGLQVRIQHEDVFSFMHRI
ncbi:MAG: ACT domain-containing protein [Carboxydocellales bacterium]|jgi:ACT domain-containing protein